MLKNKPVKSPTIWISLLTSVFYLAIVGEAIGATFFGSQNSSTEIVQAEPETATSEPTEAESDLEKPVEESKIEADNTLEKAIIAELNRVRTNPQAYADWLESQKQYYQGMLLNLPGEQPIRTNRGLRSLEEAIAFLRQQQPLPALSSSTKLNTAARQQITAITNRQQVSPQNLVYGKVTPEGIVMQLVVDDGFPDRPHRLAIFNRNHQRTGIACSEIAVYNHVCAIAYTQTSQISQPVANSEESPTEDDRLPTPPEGSTTVPSDSELTENEETIEENDTATLSVTDVIVTTKPPNDTSTAQSDRNQTTSESELESTSVDSDIATLPEETVDTTETISDDAQTTAVESVNESEATEIAENTTSQPESEVTPKTVTETTPESEATETAENTTSQPESEVTSETVTETIPESEATETAENATSQPETVTETTNNSEIAATSNTNPPSQAVETIERGTLEEGDDVIPNDGSFYDSYPLEGSAGDSLTITLESQDFDTFLAIMDRDGNIIEQNDDIDEQNSNSRLEITLPDDGTYSVIVNAYEQQGTGNYVLTVRR